MMVGDMVLRCYPHNNAYYDDGEVVPGLIVKEKRPMWPRHQSITYDVLWADGSLTKEGRPALVDYNEEMSAINEKRSVQASLKA
jgi:hypothetical protein